MLSFSLSEEQAMMKETAAKLVKDAVLDNAHDMDEKGDIPPEMTQKVWELGISTSRVPEEYGGAGMEYSPVMNALILEELAAGDMALALSATTPSLFIYPLLEAGTEEQKKKYLPLFCAGLFVPCTLAINEPHFTYDASRPATRATRKNGAYLLEGEKCFVPLAHESSHMLVSAMCDGSPALFIVGRDNPGLTVGEREKNLGLNALRTYGLVLNNCEVSAEDRLGNEGGAAAHDALLQKTRAAMAAVGTGVSRASYEYAREYAKERRQFGEIIASRQSIAFMIAEMAYEVDSMRLLAWKAASMLEAGLDARRDCYLAKLYAGDASMKITDYGVQVLGGHGYVRDHPVERYYRNGRGIAILEGMAII
jgi:acyl-CoA dehydrogenase